MVTAKTFERLSIKSPKFARDAGTSEEVVKKIFDLAKTEVISNRRQPPPPPPAGSISQSEGARKYKIPCTTLQGWTESGLLKVLLKTSYRVYLEENRLAVLAAVYHKKPGRGRRTVQKKFKPLTALQ